MSEPRLGPYRLIRKLSQGGMGAVYEGFHDAVERPVAIKVLRPDFAQNPDFVTRFFNEAKAANRIGHPSIVQIFDCGRLTDGTAYIVMELLDGETVGSRMRKLGGRVPLLQTLAIARQVANALAAAHAKNIVHREAYVISTVCFHVGHFGPQRRRNKPCPLTVPAAASSALTSH
ncbi:MAG: protein kinase [Myxococcales bacterium]|nr:protein kinase [Myxococcales bacterium]